MSDNYNCDCGPRFGASLKHGKAHAEDHAKWSRRGFLQTMGLAGVGSPLLLGSSSVNPLVGFNGSAASRLLDLETDRILIMLQVKGGWDGLNTIIPFTDQKYYDIRPDIALTQAQTIGLNASLGMNPHLSDLQGFWDNGNMTVLQQTGYANSSLSHFEGTDIWVSASPGFDDSTGFLGRTLDMHYPDFLENPPASPLAVEINSVTNRLFFNPEVNMGMTLRNPDEFYRIAQNGGVYDTANVPNDSYGDELAYIRQVANFTVQYSSVIQNAASMGANEVTSYPNSNFGESMAVIARLIKGGLGAKMYTVQVGGSFDTHANQLTRMQTLFTDMGSGVKALFDDLGYGASDLDKKTLLMTFSEFGRRVEQNDSEGTDHGTSAPMFLIGGDDVVNPGIVGDNPDLINLDNRGNMSVNTDFRSIYGTVMNEWLGIGCSPTAAILDYAYEDLDLVKNPDPAAASCSLPIVLSSFSAEYIDNGEIQLNWETLSELNNSGFEIQQLFLDGQYESWTKVGFVEGSGTTNEQKQYSFTAKVAEKGAYRFRLKQLDYNGTFDFSNRVEVFADIPTALAVFEFYPNPFVHQATIELTVDKRQGVKIELYDQLGRLVRNLFDDVVHREQSLQLQLLPDGLSNGTYIVVAVGEDFTTSRKIVLAR